MRNTAIFILIGIVGYTLIALGHGKKNFYVSLLGIFISVAFFIMFFSIFL